MTDELETMAVALEQSPDYRVLRRLVPQARAEETGTVPTRIGLFADFETTGLNPRVDEVLEAALVSFRYTAEGQIVGIESAYDRLRQPSRPIPPAITRLTGITDAMVAGRSIDADEVAALVAAADLVIAHNARFDRCFAERLNPAFIEKAWACSMTQAPWNEHGFEGVKLAYLLNAAGLFHDGHRALDDCFAAIELLARPLGDTGRTALAHVLDEVMRTTWRLCAIDAPYRHKDLLRSRGYRWNNGDDGRPRTWFIDLREEALEAEIDALRAEVFDRSWQPQLEPITALGRFSDRTLSTNPLIEPSKTQKGAASPRPSVCSAANRERPLGQDNPNETENGRRRR